MTREELKILLDVEELITVTRDELEDRLDEILEKIDEGCSPVLIVADGKPDLLLFGWDDYKRRFALLYSQDAWQSIEAELTRHKEDEEFSGGQPDDLCNV